MLVYRISSEKYNNDISGRGALLYGGRWNAVGKAMLYCSLNPETALLENLIHLPSGLQPRLQITTIEIPESLYEIEKETLPENWFSFPAPHSLITIAKNAFQMEKVLALIVPSAAMHSAKNVIIDVDNPLMTAVKILKTETCYFDQRLIQ